MPWHTTPAAKSALAAIASAQLVTQRRTITTYALTADERVTYTGEAADKLQALYDAAGEAALDTPDFPAWAQGPTPSQLIAEALDRRTDSYVVAEQRVRDHSDLGVIRWTVNALVDTTVTEQDGRGHVRIAA